jgi:LPXTG-motif cell wall-anchored protein
VIGSDEWSNALTRVMTVDNVTEEGTTNKTAFKGATFYWMWNDQGLYFFADVKDDTAPSSTPTSVATLNSGDGIQFCFYPTATVTGASTGSLFFFSLNSRGGFGLSDHFVFSDGTKGAAVTDSNTAVVLDGTNYKMEGFIPATALSKSTPAITVSEGATLRFTNLVMADNGTVMSIYADCDAWFNASTCNVYTLSATAAGTTGATTAATTAATTKSTVTTASAATSGATATTTAKSGSSTSAVTTDNSPKTGDSSNALIGGALLLAMASVTVILGKKKST